MRRFILTGAPGSGKTSLIEILRGRGYAVVDEAATDVIAAEHARGVDEPWRDPLFIDKIVELQRARQLATDGEVQFHDRSPVCTLALARYTGHQPSAVLAAELARIVGGGIYEREVFFVRPLGFLEPTAARRISYEDSLLFEKVHEAEYTALGFRLVDIPAMEPEDRTDLIESYIWA
ncbi:MAG TPA: AAA family ATPase [Streptosporangiaceae bacterium]|nr:AAA family ATPase [Streptosporangiaceae bacterium]